MTYDLPKERGSNMTIIGAITRIKYQIFPKLYNTTNIDNFKDFLIKMNENIN